MIDIKSITNLLGSSLVSGVVINYAPRILKGAMREYMSKIEFPEMVEWVSHDQSLWQSLPEELQKAFVDFGPRLGPLEWLTPEWIIDSSRETAPAIASLLLSWPQAQVWLEKQVNEIKLNMKGRNDARRENDSPENL